MPQDTVFIEFDAQYDGSLLDDPTLEYAPVLMFWTSMAGGRTKTYVDVPWENEAKTRSKWVHVRLPLSDANYDAHTRVFHVRPDDTLGVEAKVTTPNEDGETTFQSVGNALLPFAQRLLDERLPAPSKWDVELDLTFNMLKDKQGQRVKKGAVKMRNFRLTLKSSGRAVNAEVDRGERDDDFSFLPHNEALHTSVLRDVMIRSTLMFTEEQTAEGHAFLPSSDEVKHVHATVNSTAAGETPAQAFMLAPGATRIDEPERLERVETWMEKILTYALKRENMAPETFIDIVEAQLKRRDNTYDDRFTLCAHIVGQALAIPPTSMPYIGDFVRTGKRGAPGRVGQKKPKRVDFNNAELHSVERFSEMAGNDGGDCEDGGCFACRIANVLQLNDFKKPLVRAASSLLRQYIVMLSLGSVRSAALGNDRHDKKTSAAEGTTIDSSDDRKVNYGAHMWCELVPVAKFVALVGRSVSDLQPEVLWPRGASRAPWTAALPYLVVEATGRLSSLLLPPTEYVVTGGDDEKKRILERIADERALGKYIDANTTTFGQMKAVRQQEMLTKQPDVRSTTFYRDATHSYTTTPLEHGVAVIDYVWANRGKRVSAKETWDNAAKYGVKPLSLCLVPPGSLPAVPNARDETAPLVDSHYPGNSLIPCAKLSEFNATLDLVGNKHHREQNTSSGGNSHGAQFFYGVPLEDRLQAPLLPATALVPSAPMSQREFRVVSVLLRHSPPIDAPGDWVQIEQMHEARIRALKNEGIDELAREAFEDKQLRRLVDAVRRALGKDEGQEWPKKASRRWTLKTYFFSMRMLKEDQGDAVADAIAADIKKLYEKGVVGFARIYVETPMPHRRTVVVQLLCNAAAAACAMQNKEKE